MADTKFRPKDVTGQRFGCLVALRRIGQVKSKSRGSVWECVCDCGRTHSVALFNLTSGSTQSCGCKRKELIGATHTTHGHTKRHRPTPEYQAWGSMLARCRNPKNSSYPDYGGRGISVDERWLDFNAFLSDMGPRPPKASLDRIDNGKGYSKENCRWATQVQQANNTRAVRRVMYRGRLVTLRELSELTGIKLKTLRARVHLGVDESLLSVPDLRRI